MAYASDGGGTGAGTACIVAPYVDCNACPVYPAPHGAEIERDNPAAAAVDAAVCCATTLAYVLVLLKQKVQIKELIEETSLQILQYLSAVC